MRLTVLSLAVLILALLGCAETVVPEQTRLAFEAMYPEAREVDWDVEDESVCEADCIVDGRELSLKFDLAGNWLETEILIEVHELPPAILHVVETHFGDAAIEEIEQTLTPGLDTLYEVDVIREGREIDILFDPTGKIIRRDD